MKPIGTMSSYAGYLLVIFACGAPVGGVLIVLSWWLLTLVVDPAKAFCDQVFCYAARKDVSLYFDDDHLSIAGASIVAADVLRKLGFRAPLHASADRRRDRAASLAHPTGATQIR